MRYLGFLAAALLLTACASTGPGSDCDECAVAEANPAGDGSAAAAASASGGQKANNAPFSGEAGARIDPKTTVGRGSGATSSSSADAEHRHTASGGSQNVAVNVPTGARAEAGTASAGGTALAIRLEYGRDLDALRNDLAAVRNDPELTPEQKAAEAAAIRGDMRALKADMALALSHAGATTTNYHQENQRNTLFGVSSSSTAGKPTAEVVKSAAEAIKGVASSAKPDDSSVPPAGVPEDPMAPEGGGG